MPPSQPCSGEACQPVPTEPINPMPPSQPNGDGSNQNTQQNQPGYQGLMPQQNNQGQQGPSEEEMVKMDQKRFEQMKKGLNQFIKQIKRIKTQVNRYAKTITLPEELTAAIAKVDELTAAIDSAATADDLQGISDDLQDSLQTIQEWMNKLPRLAQMPKMLKQADKEMTKVNKLYSTDERKIKSAKMTEELSSILTDFRTIIDQQATLLNEVKAEMKTDLDSAFDKLTEDFFGNIDNMYENDRTIQMALNVKRGITQMNSQIKQSEKLIKSLKKKKIDTAELEQILADGKTQFQNIKSLAAVKPLDADALVEALDEFMATKQSFDDKVQELTGENDYLPQMPNVQQYNMNMPTGFTFSQPINNPQAQNGANNQICNINGVETPGKCSDSPGAPGQVLGVEYDGSFDLLRDVDSHKIYLVTNGQKELVKNITELRIKYFGQPINNVSSQTLESLSQKVE